VEKEKEVGKLTVTIDPAKKKMEELEIDVRRLMDQNITLTA
jgi:hypothetical protein